MRWKLFQSVILFSMQQYFIKCLVRSTFVGFLIWLPPWIRHAYCMTFFHYAWTYRKKLKFMRKVALIIWPHWVIGRPSQRFRFAQSKRLIFIQHQSPNAFVWMNVMKYQSNCFEVKKSTRKRSFTGKISVRNNFTPLCQAH